jgi:hypothetical protein
MNGDMNPQQHKFIYRFKKETSYDIHLDVEMSNCKVLNIIRYGDAWGGCELVLNLLTCGQL